MNPQPELLYARAQAERLGGRASRPSSITRRSWPRSPSPSARPLPAPTWPSAKTSSGPDPARAGTHPRARAGAGGGTGAGPCPDRATPGATEGRAVALVRRCLR